VSEPYYPDCDCSLCSRIRAMESAESMEAVTRLMNRYAKEHGTLEGFEEFLLLRDAQLAHAQRVEAILRESSQCGT
jgi:hypothetical protein